MEKDLNQKVRETLFRRDFKQNGDMPNNNQEAELMKSFGLPVSFKDPYARSSKGDASEFYCEVCFVQMTSEEAFESHVNGVQHLKMVKNKELVR